MKYSIKLVKAFTKDKDQGNPAGVILNADDLSSIEMLKIAQDLGFSESAFVQKTKIADFKIRFFSPKEEVALCGHATIATFHALIDWGVINNDSGNKVVKTFESQSGVLPVTIYSDGFIMMNQKEPIEYEVESSYDKIADLLGIDFREILQDSPIQAISTGSPKLMVPVKSRDVLFRVTPDLDGIKEYCKENRIKGFYPFTQDTINESSHFHARQFNPLAGIDEDPITGTAAGALGVYAKKYGLTSSNKIIIEQGYIMNKAGEIFVEVNDQDVNVGGYAVTFNE